MSQHTPGPWGPFILDKPLNEIAAYVDDCIKASGGADFYFVQGPHIDGGTVDICHVGNGPRGLANARLIAAAPDLLEALRTLLSYAFTLEMRFTDADGEHRAMQQARAAIAKAEGEGT